jgi:hypothetical protein
VSISVASDEGLANTYQVQANKANENLATPPHPISYLLDLKDGAV